MKLLLQAAQGKKVSHTPIWLMRQAGRYLPEYQEVRSKYSFLEACKNPEIAAALSLQPWKRFGFDGVIVFSDIMIPAQAMGVELDFKPGPILKKPLRLMKDLKHLQIFDPQEKTLFVLETLKILKKELPQEVTLIGFCGAPFTLACYLIEGKQAAGFPMVKKMIQEEPLFIHLLLDKLSYIMISYLKAQIKAGAEIVQIFDTWAHLLTNEEYQEFIYPYQKRLIDELKTQAPLILFMKESRRFLEKLKCMEVPIVSVDHETSLSEARTVLGKSVVLQGNLDPSLLQSATKEDIRKSVQNILNQMSGQAHIFNLGHGILPNTPIDHVSFLVDVIRHHCFKR